jgi:hypothetical protein
MAKKEKQENEEVDPLKYRTDLHWSDQENRAPIKKARDLFFKEYPYERIFLATHIPPSVYLSCVRKWQKVKARIDEKLLTNIRKKAISDQSKEFIEKGLQVGIKFISRLLKREDEITPKDWKLVADSIMALHRVHQLEVGKPTDIKVYEGMSPEQIKEYLLETQRQLAEKHDMSMFSPAADVPEEELLAQYTNESNRKLH